MRIASVLWVVSVTVVAVTGCNKGSSSGAGGDAKPAAVPDCTAVVAKMASFQTSSGEPEKKLWTKMCAELSGPQKTCIVAAKSLDDEKACLKKLCRK